MRPGTFGDVLEHDLRATTTASRSGTGRSRWRCRPSAAGSRAARPASSRPATARSRTSSWASTSSSPTAGSITTGGAPRAAVGPDLTQLFVGSRGHARRHHRRPAARSTRAHAASAGRRSRSRLVRRGPRRDAPDRPARRDAGRAAPLRRDRGRPHLPHRRPGACCSCSTRATRRSSTRRWRVVAEECARRPTPDDVGPRRALARAPQRRGRARGADLARATSSTRWRSSAPLVARCRRSTRRRSTPCSGVEGTLAASAHQSHSYPDGGCLYFTFAGKVDADDRRDALLPRPRGTPGSGPCSPPAARSATTTASASTGPGSWPRRSAPAFDVLVGGQGTPSTRTASSTRASSASRLGPVGAGARGRSASGPMSGEHAGDGRDADERPILVVDVGTTRRAGGGRAAGRHGRRGPAPRACCPSSPAPGLVEFDAAAMADGRPRRGPGRAGRGRARSTRSASPTSGPRRSCGTGPPASRSGRGSAGRTCARSATASCWQAEGLRFAPNQSATKVAYLLDGADPDRGPRPVRRHGRHLDRLAPAGRRACT